MPKLDITNANNVVEFHPQKAQFIIQNLGGPKGDRGERGEAGAGLRITDTVATYENLPTTLEYADSGAAYFVREDGKLYIWNGYEFPPKNQGSQFQGPAGPAGQNGQNGQNGEDGFSPEATVTQVGAGAHISITDKNGTTEADVAGFVVDQEIGDSANPVQNSAVRNALDALDDKIDTIAGSIYPIGSVVTFYDNNDHSTHLGFTWERFAAGKMVIGYDSSDSDFNTIGATGGEKAHTLTVDEIPSHNHKLGQMYDGYHLTTTTAQPRGIYGDYAQNVLTTNTGGGQAHNNLPPYIVASLWIRTA